MANVKNVPERLWKYRAWDTDHHARDMIVDGEIYFASKEQLNDPFEFRYRDKFPDAPAELERFAKELCALNYPYDSPQERRAHFRNLLAEIKHLAKAGGGISPTAANIILGVFSVTEINNDILMWSHYADHHNGICIGLRPAIIGRLFMPVQYLTDVPIHDVWGYVQPNDDDFLNLSLFKSTRWEHEREWRTIKKIGPDRYPGCVDQIVIGARADEKTRTEVLAAVDATAHEIKVFEAKLSERKFGLDIVPVR